ATFDEFIVTYPPYLLLIIFYVISSIYSGSIAIFLQKTIKIEKVSICFPWAYLIVNQKIEI
ncbi:hypothetical protein COA00_33000, partial [Bacillus cereus]